MIGVRALCFDLDETLVYLDHNVLGARMIWVCEQLAQAGGPDPARLREEHQRLVPEVWALSLTDGLTGMQVMRQLWRRALLACGRDDAELAALGYELYWRQRKGIIVAFADVAGTLDALPGELPTAVITNGPADTQRDKLEILGLDGGFKAIVASSEVGAGKPQPAIFRETLKRIGLKASPDVWHVGDSLDTDVAGAKAAGLTAVWLNREGRQRPAEAAASDYEISSLSELPGLLGL